MILKTEGKVAFCGVGKSGLIARKAAATLSSVGTPSFYLDGNDFSHGDSGSVTKKDIMLIYSSSGETNELKKVIIGIDNQAVLRAAAKGRSSIEIVNGVSNQ